MLHSLILADDGVPHISRGNESHRVMAWLRGSAVMDLARRACAHR